MSVTSAALALSGSVRAAAGDSFTGPAPADFWQPLSGSGAWAFTRPMGVSLIITALMAVALLALTRNAAAVPTRGQHLVEYIFTFVRNDIGRDMIGSRHFRPFLPLLFGLFTFLLANNLAGVIPPFQSPPTARIGFPIALVLVVYLTYHYVGFRQHGALGYIKSMVPSGIPGAVAPFILLIEAVTKFFVQPLTLTLRLFGNMFAGHMVLVLFILGGEYMLLHGGPFLKVAGVSALAGGVVMTVFEILIQVLQAYVFTLLTASYISSSLEEH